MHNAMLKPRHQVSQNNSQVALHSEREAQHCRVVKQPIYKQLHKVWQRRPTSFHRDNQ